jgi:hypothetical protein
MRTSWYTPSVPVVAWLLLMPPASVALGMFGPRQRPAVLSMATTCAADAAVRTTGYDLVRRSVHPPHVPGVWLATAGGLACVSAALAVMRATWRTRSGRLLVSGITALVGIGGVFFAAAAMGFGRACAARAAVHSLQSHEQ